MLFSPLSSVKKLSSALLLLASLSTAAWADVRIDIKNESSEACSVAFNARVDKTKWMTAGWYVFVSGEEAPVILEGANDIRDVFLYHDCGLELDPEAEHKKAWVRTNLKFTDYLPKENDDEYEEVEFVRLTSNSYTITAPGSKPRAK